MDTQRGGGARALSPPALSDGSALPALGSTRLGPRAPSASAHCRTWKTEKVLLEEKTTAGQRALWTE